MPNSGGICPANLLPARPSHSRLAKLPNSGGICPVKLLLKSGNSVTWPPSPVVTPYHSPMGASLSHLSLFFQLVPPVALYRAINAAPSVASSFCCSGGATGTAVGVTGTGVTVTTTTATGTAVGVMGTATRFADSSPSQNCSAIRWKSDGMPCNAGGTHPLNWFPERPSVIRLASSPSSGGIGPVNWFPERSRYSKLVRLPNSGGIKPVSWFLPRCITVRLVRLPNSGGIEPVN